LQPPVFQGNLSNDFLKKDFKSDTPDLDRFFQKYVFINLRDMRAKFSHNTPNGSVYDLMYDDMPCLVPDTKRIEKMPLRNLKNETPVDKIPNAVPRTNIIP